MSNDNFGNNSSLAKLHQLTLKFRDKNKVFEKNIQGYRPQIGERPSLSGNRQLQNFRFSSSPLKKQDKALYQSPDELDKVSEIDSSRQVSNRVID